MREKRKWNRILALMLAFVMIMTNSSMTALAATVGSVVETEPAKEAGPFVYEDELIRATATLQEGAALPAGTTLTAEYGAVDEAALAGAIGEESELVGVTGLHFGFVSESGEAVVPEGNVDIYAEFLQPVLKGKNPNKETVKMVRMAEGAAEEIAADVQENDTAEVISAEFGTEGFADFAVLKLSAKDTQRVYTYEDANVSVVATLQYAEAVPDDAEFRVTQITPSSSAYNYDAYMEALNNHADEISTSDNEISNREIYTKENTLLYDIAFMVNPTDEEGYPVEGEKVEYQPTEGSVDISITFKRNQLSNGLGAEANEDITVIHMPLQENVKEAVDSTAQATDISADDVKVEVVADSASVEGGTDQAEFVLSDFSTVAINFDDVNFTSDERLAVENYTLEYLLNHYNIVATGSVELKQHTVGAIMVKEDLTGDVVNNFGQDSKASSYVGGLYNSGMMVNGNAKDYPLYVGDNNVIERPGEGSPLTVNGRDIAYDSWIKVYKNPGYIDWRKIVSAISATSGGMLNNGNVSYDMPSENQHGTPLEIPAGINTKLTLGECKNRTSYIRLTGFDISNPQATIINITDSGEVVLPDIIDLSTKDSGDNMPIVFNIPNASRVTLSGNSSYGHVIAPNADIVSPGGNYSGCLIGKNMSLSGEGHMWPYTGGSLIPTSGDFAVRKTVNGEAPAGAENGKFTFRLEQIGRPERATPIEPKEVQNNGETVDFGEITYAVAGTYYYKITETGTYEGYTTDTSSYIAKVDVTSAVSGEDTVYSIESTTYYKGTQIEDVIDANKVTGIQGITFNNTKDEEKGSLSITKLPGANTDLTGKTFYVKVTGPDDYSTVVAVNGGETKTLSNLKLGDYTVTEVSDAQGNPLTDEFVYTVKVNEGGNGATVTVGSDVAEVTVRNTIKTTDVSGTKTWIGVPQSLTKPEVTIELYRDDKKVAETVLVNDAYSFTELEKYDENGEEYVYTVKEVVGAVAEGVEGTFTEAQDGFDFTNTYSEKTAISGTKTWVGVPAGTATPEVTIVLYRNNKRIADTKLENDAYSFTNLEKYDSNGAEYVYTVQEIMSTEDSVHFISSADESGKNFTNTYTDKMQISGTKRWVGVPESVTKPEVTIELYRNDEKVAETKLDENNAYSFTELEKYDENGKEYEYTVKEAVGEVAEGVEGTFTGAQDGFNFTNTYSEKIEVSGTKTWVGVPESVTKPEVTIELYRDNEKVAETKLDENNAYSFTELEKYNGNGVEYEYTVKEVVGEVAEGVEGTFTGVQEGFNFTNTYSEKMQISGTKKWVGVPESVTKPEVTIELYRNDEKTAETKLENDAYSFTELEKYDETGKEYTYTVKEVVGEVAEGVTGTFTGEQDGFNFTNTYNEEIDINVKKEWVDNDNKYKVRPESITVKLFENDSAEPILTQEVKVGEDGNWSWTFEKLPKYDSEGKEIAYSIKEDAVAGYVSEITGDAANGFTITNSVELGSLKIVKAFAGITADELTEEQKKAIKFTITGPQDYMEEVTYDQFENGEYLVKDILPEEYTVAETAAADMVENYTLTVSYDVADGKTTVIKGEEPAVVTVTNTYSQNVGNLEIKKTFTGDKIPDEVKKGITFTITGPEDYSNKVTYEQFTDGKYTLENLPLGEYKVVETNAETIEYTLQVKGNDAAVKVEKDQTAGVEITNDYKEKVKDGSLIVRKILSLQGEIVQMDVTYDIGLFTDKEGTNLYRKETFDMSNGPADVKFDKLPEGTYYVYELDYAGNAITSNKGFAGLLGDPDWFGFEAAVTVSRGGTVKLGEGQNDLTPVIVTNDYPDLPEGFTTVKISISGTKRWIDNNNSAKVRPGSLKLTLNDGSQNIALQSADPEKDYYIKWNKGAGANEWTYIIKNVPKTDKDGNLIDYSVIEETVDGYESASEEVVGERDESGNIIKADFENTYIRESESEIEIESETEVENKTGKVGKVAKTNDPTNYVIYIILLLAAAALCGAAVYAKKKKKNDK